MTDAPPTLYCANHPQTPTSLRCNRCDKPICTKCAVLTPTGYRCKECVRGQQRVFDTAQWKDYLLAFPLAALIAFLGSFLAPVMHFLTLFVAPIVGVIIAETVRFVTHRRRSQQLFRVTALAAVLGSLPLMLIQGIDVLHYLSIYQSSFLKVYHTSRLTSLVWYALYAFLVTSTAYYRLAGVVSRKY
jgi:hypothetical protein